MFLFLFASISIIYLFFTIFLTVKWRQMPVFQFSESNEQYLISIIVPVRNEAGNIEKLLADLARQTFTNFELIIVDDASTDSTKEIVQSLVEASSLTIHLLDSNRKEADSPKKGAIKQGIAKASGTLILTTDGDCRVGENWLRDLHSFYCLHKPKLISAGVTFHQEESGFEKMQTVEFMSLIGAGAVAMYLKAPNMCNGANLMYEKAAFEEVGGFAGSENLASGDDEFLMHKIAKVFPEKVLFLKNRATVVSTKAQKSLKSFVHQRKRWASKWNHYDNWQAILVAIFIFSVHFFHLAGFIGLFFLETIRLPIIGILLTKGIAEFFYLRAVLHFYGHRDKDKWILATQLFHSLYIVFIGMAGKMGGYQWKGRRLR